MENKYTLKELSKEEGEALTKDMLAVLEKHGCEMGAVASIQLLKRVPVDIISPFMPKNGENPDKTEENPPKA